MSKLICEGQHLINLPARYCHQAYRSANCETLYRNGIYLKKHCGWSKVTWEGSDTCNRLIKFETADGYWEKYNCDDNGNINLHSKKQ